MDDTGNLNYVMTNSSTSSFKTKDVNIYISACQNIGTRNTKRAKKPDLFYLCPVKKF